MQVIAKLSSAPSRRSALKLLATWGGTGVIAVALPARSFGQTPVIAESAIHASWRALSRVAYGPSPSLIQSLASSASSKAWALAQLDAAWSASRLPPSIAADLIDFNASLPDLMDGARREREARKQLKTKTLDDGGPQQLRRMDFSEPADPLHFSRRAVQQASAWRLMAASQPEIENPLLARMTEFWFNHLNVYVGKGSVRPFVGHYWVNVARKHALGKFEDLLLASARHPAMLGYLDQAQSVADGTKGPQGKQRGLNENYARELMELHTLGVDGGYSQADVRELARVLTGWTVAPQDASGFRFAPRTHDTGRKVVLGQYFPRNKDAAGEQEGIDAIRMLARHPATAQRVCLRLAQYFIADVPSPAVVAQLRATFLSTQGDIRAVMRTLLESTDFWAPENRLFKTPLDFAASALSAIHTGSTAQQYDSLGRKALVMSAGFLSSAGQPLFGWQTPDGYKFDADTWLVPEALTRRADFALSLARTAPEPEFLNPFLGAATRAAVAREPVAMRAGLMLASPEFMAK
jgi:uncharacterized protein (DUF1800 family)